MTETVQNDALTELFYVSITSSPKSGTKDCSQDFVIRSDVQVPLHRLSDARSYLLFIHYESFQWWLT